MVSLDASPSVAKSRCELEAQLRLGHARRCVQTNHSSAQPQTFDWKREDRICTRIKHYFERNYANELLLTARLHHHYTVSQTLVLVFDELNKFSSTLL